MFSRRTITKIIGIEAVVVLFVVLVGFLNWQTMLIRDKDTAIAEPQTIRSVSAGQQYESLKEEILLREENANLKREVAELRVETDWLESLKRAFSTALQEERGEGDLLLEQIVLLLGRLSENRGAPVTLDASSPWETLQGMGEAMTERDFVTAHTFFDAAFRDSCSVELFVNTMQERDPPTVPIAFLDEAIGREFAVVKHAIGDEKFDDFTLLLLEEGRWVIPVNPAVLCR